MTHECIKYVYCAGWGTAGVFMAASRATSRGDLAVVHVSRVPHIFLLRLAYMFVSLVSGTKKLYVVFPDCGGLAPLNTAR